LVNQVFPASKSRGAERRGMAEWIPKIGPKGSIEPYLKGWFRNSSLFHLAEFAEITIMGVV
jgi:hypothetical protein